MRSPGILELMIYLTVLTFLGFPLNQAWAQYRTSSDRICDGFPQVQVTSFEGSCVGLVADKNLKDERTQEGLVFPRKIVELTPKRFLILDMGGWSPPNRGALWELDLQSSSKKLWKLVKGLQLPHGFGWGPDGQLYIGESHRIIRFSKEALLQRQVLKADVVVEGLKDGNPSSMHPLINFTFGEGVHDKGDLYVNIGAPTDACVKDAPRKCGAEGQQAVIRRYKFQPALNRYDSQFRVVAEGLRNSMGLVSHPSGLLLQAENSRDFNSAQEPYDELNVVEDGKHYGWPYCYNFQATSPEWKGAVSCQGPFEPAYLLFPPHSAPLDLVYYKGSMFEELNGKLLVSWHGYKPTGSRLVALPTDEMGKPISTNSQWEFGTGNSKTTASPEGGSLRATQYLELITSWDKKDGVRPAGAPVGILIASDGSIFLVEDKNKTILRVARSRVINPPPAQENSSELEKKVRVYRAVKKLESNPAMKQAYDWINQNVFQKNCTLCHEQLKGESVQAFEFMIGDGWIEAGSLESLLVQRLRGLNGLQKMPLGSDGLPEQAIKYIEDWITRL